MPRVPAAVARAAESSHLGALVRRYPAAIGLQVYFGICAALFTAFIACMGAPWPPVTGFGLLAAAFLVPALIIRLHRAAFLYQHGLVITGFRGDVQGAGRWAQLTGLEWTDRRLFFFFTLTYLHRSEFSMRLGGDQVFFTTAYRDDARSLDNEITDRLRAT